MSQETVVLVDGQWGVFVPQRFVLRCVIDGQWKGVSMEQEVILTDGPLEENYWEVWEEVLNSAHYIEVLSGVTDCPSGEGWEEGDAPGQWKRVWSLWQDGDLFAYCGDGEDFV